LKLRVDVDRCQGHGMCAVTAPELFELGGEGKAVVLVDRVDFGQLDGARAAEASCPELAIVFDAQ
jgi:ferredoxin